MDGVVRRPPANAREITVLCAVDDVAGIVHSSLDAGLYHMPDLQDAIEALGGGGRGGQLNERVRAELLLASVYAC